MTQLGRACCTLVAASVLAAASGAPAAAQRSDDRKPGDDRRPSLAFRATPPVGFSPLRVRIVVDLKGGSDDYADFYCPEIEWDWGDGAISESSEDCEPYEPGKSAIRRRFSAEHTFKQSGVYQVFFRIKQRDKTIAQSNGQIQVRAGIRDGFDN